MDVALCTLDNNSYTAQRFERLPEAEIGKLRRFLVCPECKGPAFYRKESRSGQAACFGARPHEPWCSLAATESRYGGGAGQDQDERINLGERIQIDFDYGAAPINHVDPAEPADPNGRGGRYVRGQGQRAAVMHRRLSTLLRNLMHSNDFRNSDQLISMPEGEFRVRSLFVNFDDINHAHAAEYRGFWGMLSDARFGGSQELWLNTGGRDDVSIVVPAELVGSFAQRFRVDDAEDLAGAYVLVFGELKVSLGGKAYIACNDLQRITVNLAT